ncbi:MAG: ATP-binding cassette domain-containing protein [Chlorobi bacterium]|nr:ATP-binding cassette domain-containing protein [Chlorobiota bacterium]
MELFSVHNVNKTFINYQALTNISLSVNKGSIFGLLGPNGAGKTTLIRIINQITAPDSGEIIFNGEKLKANDIYKIGYLPEERGLYKKMKVGEQAIYLARLKGLSKNDALKKLKYWFEKFEIQPWWDKKVEELSKGMQQKIQFIVTILHEPQLLIFDEPFSGFDPINTKLLKQEILNLRDKGATVIFSTHNMSSVEELCDDITLINKSKTILQGNINEIRNKYKANTYELEYTNPDNQNLNILENFEVLEKSQKNGYELIKIKLKNGQTPNTVLNKLLPHVDIKSFNEVIPNMNEIFIKVVEETND